MKKLLKVLGVLFGVVVVLIIGALVYVNATAVRDFSSTPLPNITASKDPEVIARGEYVVNAQAHCSICHQKVEFAKQRVLGAELAALEGGYAFEAGPFGTFYAANLTSDEETGLGKLSDGQLARSIRHGVNRHGRLAAFMSFAVGDMADEDLTAVVSYLRTLPPRKNAVKDDEWGIIAKALSGSFNPRPAPPATLTYVPPGGISVERGQYLANGPAFCYGCHTPADPMKGFAAAGPRFSGEASAEPDPTDAAFEFVTPNLTPDPETGLITKWSEDDFVKRLKAGGAFPGSKMPWPNFARLTEDDMRSLYRYLRQLPPTKHDVGPTRRAAGWKPGAAN